MRVAGFFLALPLLAGGASIVAMAPDATPRVAEGQVLITRGTPLLVEDGKGLAFVSPVPSASLVGFERLIELVPGDRIRYRWSEEIAGVRLAEVVEVAPLVNTEAPFIYTEGELATALQQGKAPEIYDVRPVEEYRKGRIQGALSRPLDSLPGKGTPAPQQDPSPVVVYGDGPRDGRAPEAARRLLKNGTKDVRVLQGGLGQWVASDHPLEISAEDIARSSVNLDEWVVVDVRPFDRGVASRPARAVSVPPDAFRWQDFDGHNPLGKLLLVGEGPGDPEPLRMADRIRRLRSARVTRTPLAVYCLQGGFSAWRGAGLPLERGTPPTTTFSLRPPGAGEIGLDEFERLWQARGGEASTFLDVRRSGASQETWVLAIPLEELASRIEGLPREREILVFCAFGERSRVAAELLRVNGFRARYLRAIAPH